MKQKITHIGELAMNLLVNGSGIVIAVFEKSWYLQAINTTLNHHTLFCLGTDLLVDGPINARTTYSQLPAIENGSPWHSKYNKLTIGNAIDLNCANAITTGIKNPRAVCCNSSDIDRSIIKLLQSHSQNHEKQNSTNQQINDRLQKGIQQLELWLQTENTTSPKQTPILQPDQISNLIGTGGGLTPTGDDILVGALIALKHTGRITKFRALSDQIKKYAPGLTNHISYAHLLAACEGKAVSLLHELLESISTNDTTQVLQALHALDCYGHSSGKDALRGLLAVINSGVVNHKPPLAQTTIGE